jgi:hypothetical protein
MASDALASRALREGPLEARCLGLWQRGCWCTEVASKKWGEWDV